MQTFNIKKDLAEAANFYHENGYVILDDIYQNDEINAINDDIDSLLGGSLIKNNVIFNAMRDEYGKLISVSQPNYAALPSEEKSRLLTSGNWRIHGLIEHLDSARNLGYKKEVHNFINFLIGRTTRPEYSINFYYGSDQALHQDNAVFHISPLGNLIGSWIALEDVCTTSGPLVVYPKSHLEPMYSKFNNYPQTNLRTADDATFDGYYNFVYETAQKYERVEFLPKKGQLLLWHGGLIHGGKEILDKEKTRKSIVIHYRPDEMDYFKSVNGPFRW